MATVVTVNCPRCGNVSLRPEGVHLFLFSNKWPTDYYAFFCPKCKEYREKDSDDHATHVLYEGGVPHTLTDVPLEVVERKALRVPLTGDDVLNLVSYLRDHDTMPPLEKADRKAFRK